MNTSQLTPVLPLWWLCFRDRVVQLRNQCHRDDIQYHYTSLTGYISGLFCTDTIDDNQYQLLDTVANNAKEWAESDAAKEARS